MIEVPTVKRTVRAIKQDPEQGLELHSMLDNTWPYRNSMSRRRKRIRLFNPPYKMLYLFHFIPLKVSLLLLLLNYIGYFYGPHLGSNRDNNNDNMYLAAFQVAPKLQV